MEGMSPAAPRVLVVDDDPNIRKMMVAALRRDGYDFSEAANGREALDSMRSDHPSVVLLDLMMPVMSGWDAAGGGTMPPRQIPVIIVSANRAPEIATAATRDLRLPSLKPFDIGVLSALVKSCVGNQLSGGAAMALIAEKWFRSPPSEPSGGRVLHARAQREQQPVTHSPSKQNAILGLLRLAALWFTTGAEAPITNHRSLITRLRPLRVHYGDHGHVHKRR
jgi:CheY-like chemotaxis protein